MSYDKQPKEHTEQKCEEKNEKLKTHNALFILVVIDKYNVAKHLIILKGISQLKYAKNIDFKSVDDHIEAVAEAYTKVKRNKAIK